MFLRVAKTFRGLSDGTAAQLSSWEGSWLGSLRRCSGRPSQQFDIWVLSEWRLGVAVRAGGGSEEEDPERVRQMEGGTRDRVRQSDKGEVDKRCLTGWLSVAEGIGEAR